MQTQPTPRAERLRQFGREIYELRNKHFYTVAQLAHILKISVATQLSYEDGEQFPPRRICLEYVRLLKPTPVRLSCWNHLAKQVWSEQAQQPTPRHRQFQAELERYCTKRRITWIQLARFSGVAQYKLRDLVGANESVLSTAEVWRLTRQMSNGDDGEQQRLYRLYESEVATNKGSG